MVTAKIGLLRDPHFSGTTLAWLLDEVPGARTAAERGLGFRHGKQLAAVEPYRRCIACNQHQQCLERALLFNIHSPEFCRT
jgi:hypothetical protein